MLKIKATYTNGKIIYKSLRQVKANLLNFL